MSTVVPGFNGFSTTYQKKKKMKNVYLCAVVNFLNDSHIFFIHMAHCGQLKLGDYFVFIVA